MGRTYVPRRGEHVTLNAQVSPTLADTFNYAAPVVALCVSALLLLEPLTLLKLVSGGVAIVGIPLMIAGLSTNGGGRPCRGSR
jgi:drug/metabolite transporter (DMT)-like permease